MDLEDKLSLRHLVIAQTYGEKINKQHPIEAIRDDIFMYKFDKDGNLKAKNKKDYELILDQVEKYYDYLLFLQKNSHDILSKYAFSYTVKLYRGTDRFLEGSQYYALPTSWTNSIDNALGTWVSGEILSKDNLSGRCCLLELSYPSRYPLAYHAFRPGYILNGREIPEDYRSNLNILEDSGIYIHNQPEFEVILPPFKLQVTGYSEIESGGDKYLVTHCRALSQSRAQASKNLEKLYVGNN